MNEEALRAMVRDAVARRLADVSAPMPLPPPLTLASHASHFRYLLPDTDGPCLIEPAVPCNHCGYCQSHGH